jgi:hypothetical protein
MYRLVQRVHYESPKRHQPGLLGTKTEVQQTMEISRHGSGSE